MTIVQAVVKPATHAQRAARGRAEWLAAAAVLLFLLAVAGTYWGLHCPSLRAVGC